MFQKMELQQLQSHSLEEIKTYKDNAVARKAELEAAKAKGGKAWTTNMQEELDEIALFLVDVEEVIEEKQKVAAEGEQKAVSNTYVPKAGTEKMVHLSIVRGRRYNPRTGKEETKPFVQMFTFAEWQLFKKNFAGLGYTIIEALHDPYGDAAELVAKDK